MPPETPACDGRTTPATTCDLTFGAQRQQTGTAGRIETAQVAAYLAYAVHHRDRL